MVFKDFFPYKTKHRRYNTVWIVNTEIVLDPNNNVIKRLWCNGNDYISEKCVMVMKK